MSANNQKLGLINAATVNANQTFRRRAKSFSAMKRRQIGLASVNTAIAVTKTTIIAFMLVIRSAFTFFRTVAYAPALCRRL